MDSTQQLQWHGFPIKMAWQPTGEHIAMGDEEAIHFWEVETGMHQPLFGYDSKVSKFSWSFDGRFLAINNKENLVIWDCCTQNPTNEELFPLAFLVSQKRMAGPKGTAPILLKQHKGEITSLVFQKNGELLASGDDKGEVHIWNVQNSKIPLESISLDNPVSKIAWSPEGQRIGIGGTEGMVSIFNFEI